MPKVIVRQSAEGIEVVQHQKGWCFIVGELVFVVVLLAIQVDKKNSSKKLERKYKISGNFVCKKALHTPKLFDLISLHNLFSPPGLNTPNFFQRTIKSVGEYNHLVLG